MRTAIQGLQAVKIKCPGPTQSELLLPLANFQSNELPQAIKAAYNSPAYREDCASSLMGEEKLQLHININKRKH